MEAQNNIIDVEEIKTLIPHRYPFLLVDRVLDYIPGKSIHAIKNAVSYTHLTLPTTPYV